MAIDLVIYAVIAAGLVFWLRSILGTRTGDERERPNPFTQQPDNKPTVVPLRDGQGNVVQAGVLPGYTDQAAEVLERHMSVAGPAAEQGLLEIARADRDFAVPHFLRG
ncbi:MAG: Tim44 domain-containing protein, partial [Alphaproteobacteria bacterium]|nr:Tim44 domain-containing protein [Alphaproteobacteria bacterium]